ncbi:electron transport complex subunit G [Thiomicrorhabdus immobilis]|uniref:Ion-translocating oxidoreductase complex subunit G n=1 Tax=Thiomicrorhabdus immobilis TaxID=2791037 RepID=A0ABN6CX73_9GAMM|nr:electron transport complex subunit RsxG [Thiomicrorhabdus immobilis]BCN93219.1 electron transport complex subunit G [Thiomicrorhabdus immobilis]
MTANSKSTQNLLKTMFSSAGKLTLFVFISIILLLSIRALTGPEIEKAERETLLNTFAQVLPQNRYDNDPLQDTLVIKDPAYLKLLGSSEPVTVYRAYKNQQPAGAIFSAIAPNGYSGNIYILIAVYPDGRISGVRIIKHKETPGLGDKIEINKSNWVLEFDGRNVREDNDPRWAVQKDGGDFDQFTGATITPRAVVEAVKHALLVVNDLGERLYE